MSTATAAPPVVPPRDGVVATGGQDGGGGGGDWNGFTVRLWLPITQGRPHAAAVGDYATAFELARAKEGGGHHKDADFDVLLVVVEYPGRRAE